MSQTAVFVQVNGNLCEVLPYTPDHDECASICSDYLDPEEANGELEVSYTHYEIGEWKRYVYR